MERPSHLPGSVRTVLSEAGLAEDDPITPVLLDLQRLGRVDAPAPSPRLAALLEEPRGARHRKPPRRRGAVVALVVAASIGTGITAAAANPEVREAAVHVVTGVAGPAAPRIDVPSAVDDGTPAADGTGSTAPSGRPTGVPGAPSADARPSAKPSPTGSPASPAKASAGTQTKVPPGRTRSRLPNPARSLKPAPVPAIHASVATYHSASGARTSE